MTHLIPTTRNYKVNSFVQLSLTTPGSWSILHCHISHFIQTGGSAFIAVFQTFQVAIRSCADVLLAINGRYQT